MIEIQARAVLMIPPRPGAKPRPVEVASVEACDELIIALSDAKSMLLAASQPPARIVVEAADVVEAVEAVEDYCGKPYSIMGGRDWCAEPAGHDGDCGDQPRNQVPVSPFITRETELAEVEAKLAEAGTGEPADPDELCDCGHAAGHHGAGVGQCAICACRHVVVTTIRADPAAARLTVYADDMGDDPTDVSGMHDDGLEDAAAVIAPAPGSGEPCACGHHYGAHLYGHGCCLRAGCRCRRYRLAATAAQDEPDEAAILAAGELAAAEVDEARSRERLSDSAAGPLAEEEPELCGAERDGRRCKREPHEGGEHDCDGWRWSDVAYAVPHRHGDPSVSDEVRAQMLAELRSRPGYPRGGGRAQMAAQRALDEQQVDAAIAAGVRCSCGWTGPGLDSEAHRREHEAALGEALPLEAAAQVTA